MGLKKVEFICDDGKLVPWDDAREHVLAHSLHYGIGAFEGIRAYLRKDGTTAVFRLREHIDRLFESCHIATMEVPHTRERVMQVAWSHASGGEQERAYALEVLDTLLPRAHRTDVLDLLDASAASDAAHATLQSFFDRLESAPPSNAWIRCCALFAGMEEGVLPPADMLQRWAASPETTLSAVALAALQPHRGQSAGMLTIEKVMILRAVPMLRQRIDRADQDEPTVSQRRTRGWPRPRRPHPPPSRISVDTLVAGLASGALERVGQP